MSSFPKCVVCLEPPANEAEFQRGLSCPSGHFVCEEDLSSLRQKKCAIGCPVADCSSQYNPLIIYHKIQPREQLRYMNIIRESIATSIPDVSKLQSALYDVITLKCPSCHCTVDPLPDACSAVMCLNCGHHYCNYCFAKFVTGDITQDRAAAHAHVASHSSAATPEARDPFLPAEVVKEGQAIYLKKKINQFLSLAMSSAEYGSNSALIVSLVLLMSSVELKDLGFSALRLWHDAVKSLQGSAQAGKITEALISDDAESNVREGSTSEAGINIESELDEILGTMRHSTEGPPAGIVTSGATISRRGAVQLANAIITGNSEAANQIFFNYGNEIDLDYVEERHGLPLASLAIIAGQVWIALRLIEMGADPIKCVPGGRSVLYVAAESGIKEILECIVRVNPGIDMNAHVTDEIHKYSCVHVLARYNHGHLIKYVTSLGANVDATENEHGYTALILALVLGHTWVCRELLSCGCRVDIQARNGRTALFVAAERGLSDIIRQVIKLKRSDINATVVTSGLKMIHVAAYHRQPHVVSLLISLGAALDIQDEDSFYIPLAMALIAGNVTSALDLMKAGANLRIPSKSGRLPMYIAIEKGLLEVASALLELGGIDVNEPTNINPGGPVMPLHVAILHKQPSLVPMLLARGANVNAVGGEKHCTPLIMATILELEYIVLQLINAGANVRLPSPEGRMPIYIASEKGCEGIVRILLESGKLDVNAPATREIHKGTALHVASMFDRANVVALLLEMGADPNVEDSQGRTPLDVAEVAGAFAAKHVLVNTRMNWRRATV